MTEQERAETFLRKRSGEFFCAACLAHELGISAFHGRNVLWVLQALPGFEMRGRRCVSCSRGKRAIRHVGGFDVLSATAHLVVFLLGNRNIYVCDSCLAFAVELSLPEVRQVIASLRPFEEFHRREGACTVCARVTNVTAGQGEGEDETDGDRVTELVTGTASYRGWRIDLLSYRVKDGWRPFALIKGPVGALVPDMPSLLWNRQSSKVIADAEALSAAKTWVDKTFDKVAAPAP